MQPTARRRSDANRRHHGGGDQRSKAGNLAESLAALILGTNALNLLRDGRNVDLRLIPLLPQPIQQPAQTRGQVLLSIFHHGGQNAAR